MAFNSPPKNDNKVIKRKNVTSRPTDERAVQNTEFAGAIRVIDF